MSTGRVAIGLAFIVVGGLFVLGQFGLVEAGQIVRQWWPAGLIVIGVAQLMSARRAWLGPVILIAVGVALLFATAGVITVSVWALLWPLAIIGVGVWLVFGKLVVPRPRATGADAIDLVTMFSGHESRVTSTAFKGGSITVMFGGVELDLRDATPAPGGAEIQVTAAFGGAEITVPTNWKLEVSGLPIFGAFSNKVRTMAPLPDDAPVLRIQGLTLFGGVEIKG